MFDSIKRGNNMAEKEKKDFRDKKVYLSEWMIKLQEDFPFMEQDPDNSRYAYNKWGFECSGG